MLFVPELPDLIYIEDSLRRILLDRRIEAVRVYEPVVLRTAVSGGFAEALRGRKFVQLRRHGPFLDFSVPPYELIVHFMLAGRFAVREPPIGARRRGKGHCFSLDLEGPLELAYLDDRRMGRVYLVDEGCTAGIPGFATQGVDVLSEAFSLQRFRELVSGRRQQVRVFLMDQTALSAIGNAYADEILFAARIHPKTGCHHLGPEELDRLHRSIGHVLREATASVRSAGRPVEEKVREHCKVRGRHGEPCPVCGTTIRRTGVLGYDSYFCPRCQRSVKPGFVPWEVVPREGEAERGPAEPGVSEDDRSMGRDV
jgi:formamidopyrimidine-DNA glycosylase